MVFWKWMPPDMGGAANSGRRKGSVIRIGLQPRDQLLHILRWQVLSSNEHQRVCCEKSYWIEILQEVIANTVCCSAKDVGVQLPDAQRVAVGRGAGDAGDTDAASRTRDVLDDQRLTKMRPHAVANDARDQIRRPARREWDDHRDRIGRERLVPSQTWHGRQCGSSGRARCRNGPSRNVMALSSQLNVLQRISFLRGSIYNMLSIEIHITGRYGRWS